jgi:C4-dicarboxylate-specific signal transduction histidine kinase
MEYTTLIEAKDKTRLERIIADAVSTYHLKEQPRLLCAIDFLQRRLQANWLELLQQNSRKELNCKKAHHGADQNDPHH